MDSTGPRTSKILIILENFQFSLNSIQYTNDSTTSILFANKFISVDDKEIPRSLPENLVGYLQFPESSSSSSPIEFFKESLTSQVACNLIDETCEHFFFIFRISTIGNYEMALFKFRIDQLDSYGID